MRKFFLTFILTVSFLWVSEVYAQTESIKWYSIQEAEELTKTDPKKLFVDVYTDWCGWCKVMDKNTFTDPEIAAQLNENFYAVKLNAEQKEDITFKGHTFKFVASGRNGYHELAAALMNGKMSYPTVVFLDEQLNLLQPLPGYQKPEQLDPILDFIGNDFYKTTSWQDYLKQHNN